MTPCIAVLDAGVAGIRFTLYDLATALVRYRGRIETLGVAPRMRVWAGGGELMAELRWRPEALDRRGASREVLRTAGDLISDASVIAIGHRVAHAGSDYAGPVRIDPEVIARLAVHSPRTAQRQAYNLAAMEALLEAAPHIPQAACFDAGYHPDLRRYGARGLSFQSVLWRLHEVAAASADARLVIVHLERDTSLCATRDGQAVAAVDGLTIGVHRAPDDPRLADASARFVRRVVREIVTLAAMLGGLDGLVFTGGLGEADARLRARIVDGCAWLGLALDPERNDRGEPLVSAEPSRVSIWIVPSDPHGMVARQTRSVLRLFEAF